jgi:hypothetical protein
MVSVMPGNSRRNSTAAESSPPCSKVVRIAAGFYLGDNEHPRSMGTRTLTGKPTPLWQRHWTSGRPGPNLS